MYVYYMYVYMCVIASMYVNAHGGLNDVRFLQSFLFIHFVYQGQFILFLSCQTWSSPLLAPVASQSALGAFSFSPSAASIGACHPPCFLHGFCESELQSLCLCSKHLIS